MNFNAITLILLLSYSLTAGFSCAFGASGDRNNNRPVFRSDIPPDNTVFDPVEITSDALSLTPRHFTVNDNYGFFPTDDSLTIMDLSDLSYPATVARVPITWCWGSVSATEEYACVTSGEKILYVVDIENVTESHVVGSVEIPHYSYHSLISGDLLYITCGNRQDGYHSGTLDTLNIIDVSDPASPEIIGSTETGASVSGIVLDGNSLYLSCNSGIEIYDVTDPMNPVLSDIYEAWNIKDFAIAGDHILIANGDYFKIIEKSASDSDRIEWVFRDFFRSCYNVCVKNNIAYLFGSGSDSNGETFYKLRSLDITDIPNPVEIDNIDFQSGSYTRMRMSDDYIYVLDRFRGFTAIDVSDPANLEKTDSFYTTDSTLRVFARDGYIFLLKTMGLTIVDATDPDNEQIVSQIDLPYQTGEVDIDGDIAVVVSYGMMHIIDISDPRNPSIIKEFDSYEIYGDNVKVADGYAFVSNGSGISVVDIDPPGNSHVLTDIQFPPNARWLFVNEEYAYISTYDPEREISKLWLYTLDLPSSIKEIKSIDCPYVSVIGIDESGIYGLLSDIAYWRDPNWSAGWPDSSFTIGCVNLNPDDPASIWNAPDGVSPDEMYIGNTLSFNGFPGKIPFKGGLAYINCALVPDEPGESAYPAFSYTMNDIDDFHIIDVDRSEGLTVAASFDIFDYGLRDFDVMGGYLCSSEYNLRIFSLW